MFEDLKAAINAALAAASGDPRRPLRLMREAVIEAKTSVGKMRDGITATRRKLAAESKSLSDAERRGKMATDIGDVETAEIAREFADKHLEKVGILERKLEAQEAELEIAEREVKEMTEKLRTMSANEAPGRLRMNALNEDGSPGNSGFEGRFDELGSQLDNQSKQAAAEAQLKELKKKMGK
ncbi:MAG: hypothetical protein IH877_01140 [Gemmatimonadetes bacterium]|nr:hypothetical protein [Gemmatimonadota bacterium]